MDECLFCGCELARGSEEHLFLSALGGRIVTYKALCLICNNAFANNKTGKVDDALAGSFEEVRNGLKIWSGRDALPPTLFRAGMTQNGAEYDLAPGFIPVVRPGRLPKDLAIGTEHNFAARDEADAERLLGIVQKRGFSSQVSNAGRVQQKVPPVRRSVGFDGLKVWRSVAKTAVVGFVILYGNEQARRFVSKGLRAAVRYGTPPINQFSGWDFVNEWPVFNALTPHAKTPAAQPSGFEHSVIIADVENCSVAYVALFEHWRFSIRLGPKSNLPPRGLALNPRATKLERFIVHAQPPNSYLPRQPASFASEHAKILEASRAAFNRALQKWSEEARAAYMDELTDELCAKVQAAGEDEGGRAAAIRSFAEKLATVEHGDAWKTELDQVFNEDEKS